MDELLSMLNFLGMKDPEELFSDIPKSVRKKSIGIGGGLDEYRVIDRAMEIGRKNKTDMINFLGNGIYDRVIPEAVNYILSKPEFLDSYTPYQPEISQGMLQSMFEYQSLISDLMGMDVTNASMYDGYSALGEAARMAYRINGHSKILVPESSYDSKISVLRNYIWGLNMKIMKYRIGEDGMIDLDDLSSKIDSDTSAIVVENPNGYGILDKNIFGVKDIKKDAVLISYVDPISLGVVKPPGEYGSDIAVAEGQQLGIPMNFGGPLLGLMSFKMEHIRRSPGRIIGESIDSNGKRAYVMTLQTREQHIRRAKATSNICSNQALLTLAASAYLSIMGSTGLRKVALLTIKHSRMIKEKLSSIGVKPYFSTESFSDVMFRLERDVMEALASKNILGGLKLRQLISDTPMKDATFFTVTEKTDAAAIEKLAAALEVI
ncbi:glycine dehydrogenase (decarboxylating) related protein, subunit 1 [Thermoplasma acidophilum]|uniref:Probable glycine dehydrogenase (decarboxylating) subunit 1 n=1 Tax=Thermoplasma acidophilum (strain ATCC 25905 / DSM 1728 / JCM 9062 / NBRC 15155 / AMRC-C165) TaxID=273075 RepID=GCSPA_THEAC|nr:aminomethyl-transferring glycine dehydrogenase subunit GcvPA [Thermoplasma acidophilum]Q9HII1.1 RecName: Full=Probable glycine dehydrogenase (decarboxylating) subunit 1; AltName: Full=Glycine cleavage system P-protein subunit 1; AltName: Full=Glycine decarboxylase subunit 1; AltName: Full=Glycine dehydrogenase (aminomethyl-transferring) subunit 1 [Thermoplasma acidophilum DSM 1728]CAC12479.1 glycine dehydrogenase (decarboxylating) related protein, subunit 1 [Thermoplasma acidophilum]